MRFSPENNKSDEPKPEAWGRQYHSSLKRAKNHLCWRRTCKIPTPIKPKKLALHIIGYDPIGEGKYRDEYDENSWDFPGVFITKCDCGAISYTHASWEAEDVHEQLALVPDHPTYKKKKP